LRDAVDDLVAVVGIEREPRLADDAFPQLDAVAGEAAVFSKTNGVTLRVTTVSDLPPAADAGGGAGVCARAGNARAQEARSASTEGMRVYI
jgi:hypothetical protein